MNSSNIYIFSRPIRSGKTTLLQRWVQATPGIAGILCPDVDGRRKVYDIGSTACFDLEIETADKTEGVSVGRFVFDTTAFQQARELLRQAAAQQPNWLVIDEVGKLEMERNEGLEPAVSEIIAKYQSGEATGKLLLVVRDYLLKKVFLHYQIRNSITVSSLEKLPIS